MKERRCGVSCVSKSLCVHSLMSSVGGAKPMNRRRYFQMFVFLLSFLLLLVPVKAQAPCPVDACVTADPDNDLELIMTTRPGLITCSPPISCLSSNTGEPNPGAGGEEGGVQPCRTSLHVPLVMLYVPRIMALGSSSLTRRWEISNLY